MTPERWQRIKEALQQALELKAADRAKSLSEVCAGDLELRREVGELLSADGRAGDEFLAAGLPSPAKAEVLLATGTHLGVYEILALIGTGGMGQVYRAADHKLQRAVALKILPQQFAGDPDRIARFEREARALAALNHPNIATLHGMEKVGGWHFLIMELVEGKTLRKPLPIEEALNIARQIVDALEAAHENGITHRDLKPGNIKVKPDGTVKVLDFGLAKVASSRNTDLEESRSLSATQQGVIVGTAAYMPPEQARGMQVDKRADIWAFGVLFCEMLTGKPLFTGESVPDILAAVVRGEPDWSALPASTPPSIRRLLIRCVEKDLKKRLPNIGVARLEIDDALASPATAVADVPAPAATRRKLVSSLLTAIALLVLAFVSWYGLRTPPEVHWTGTQLSEPSLVALCPRISPDGQFLAFSNLGDGLAQLAVMKPETGNWTVLTHDRSHGYVVSADWSRDGAKLYFSRSDGHPGRIFSVPVLGGDEQLVIEDALYPQVLADGSLLVIRFNDEQRFQLYRFWPETGRVQSLKALLSRHAGNSISFRPTPNGKHVIFFGSPSDDPASEDHLYALDLTSEKLTRLAPNVSFAVGDYFPLAVSPKGESAFIELPSGNMHRVVSVPLNGSNELHTILTVRNDIAILDAGSDGSLYLDQWERPIETLRVSLEGGPPERIGTMFAYSGSEPQVLPLPDGRLLLNSQTGGRDHLLLKSQGRDPLPFVDTPEETAAPMAMVGREQVAFMIGSGKNRTIGLASLSDRRITRRLEGARGAEINSIVSSTDSKTIYYSASRSIWSISVTDGPPERLREGRSVTLDPKGQQLIVLARGNNERQLVRVPIAGGSERPVVLEGDVHLAPVDWLSPNAVDTNGRILARFVQNFWFWPLGVIDPNTGHIKIIRIGYDADMGGGWAPDGKLVLNAVGFRASVWRFRPEQ